MLQTVVLRQKRKKLTKALNAALRQPLPISKLPKTSALALQPAKALKYKVKRKGVCLFFAHRYLKKFYNTSNNFLYKIKFITIF